MITRTSVKPPDARLWKGGRGRKQILKYLTFHKKHKQWRLQPACLVVQQYKPFPTYNKSAADDFENIPKRIGNSL